ncbi:MAG TPA: Ig-like domain-containing protein, partial [Candidatus Polarisedimenticolia bacterium]|nr:Ig-like domain-containing protein [Candidatus Polarisedimenticolia bacterium]
NNDTTACGPAMFNVASTLPPGWTQTPSSLDLSLAGGASMTQSVVIASDPAAAPGFYTLTETIADAQNASSRGSASLTYNIQPQDTTPPTVSISKPANGAIMPRKGTLAITAAASDASGIAQLRILLDGKVVKSCSAATCSTKLSSGGMTSGSHTITAIATDKGGPPANTASVSVTVSKP